VSGTSGTEVVGASCALIGADVQVGESGTVPEPGEVDVEPQGVDEVGVVGDGEPPGPAPYDAC
jgi:hypothetical protein